MPLPYGIPSHDVFSNVFRHLDPVAFETVFATFATAFAKSISGVVAIDGKAVRGAYSGERRLPFAPGQYLGCGSAHGHRPKACPEPQ
jgi:hypothetical protein